MNSQKKNPLKFSDIELWALARVMNGQTIPEELPIGEVAYRLIRDMEFIGIEWRAITLTQKVGDEIISQVQAYTRASMPIHSVLPLPNVDRAPAYGVPPRPHLIYADDLKSLPPPKYALGEYPIYQQCLNALVGPSGAGKSFIALDMAGRMAIQGARVVYIAGEGLFGYSARWEVWKAFRGMRSCPNLQFFDEPVNFMESGELERFMEEIAPRKPQMIIVDTVGRCMVGADENSTRDMGLFVGACDKLIHTLGAGVLAIHHTGKDGKMRGNTSLFGACDSVLFLRRDEQDITIFNSLDMGGKNKNNQEADPIHLTLLPHNTQTDGKLFESAVLVDSYKVTADAMQSQLKAREMTILETIEGYETGLKIEAISDATQIPTPSIYRAIRKMKKENYITDVDERYCITQKGRDALFNQE